MILVRNSRCLSLSQLGGYLPIVIDVPFDILTLNYERISQSLSPSIKHLVQLIYSSSCEFPVQGQRCLSILRTVSTDHVIVGDSKVYYTLDRRNLFINGPGLSQPWLSINKLFEIFVQNLVHQL